MPTLSEATTKLQISDNLLKQDSLQNKVLCWLQENPACLKNTTYALISKQILIPGVSQKHILDALYSLTRKQLIIDDGTNRTSRKNIFINYANIEIPPEILEKASEREKEKAQETFMQKADKFLIPKKPLKQELLGKEVTQNQAEKIDFDIPAKDFKEGLNLTFTININIK